MTSSACTACASCGEKALQSPRGVSPPPSFQKRSQQQSPHTLGFSGGEGGVELVQIQVVVLASPIDRSS